MFSRRHFLGAAAAGLTAAPLTSARDARAGRKKLAVVTTEWRYLSHA